MPLVLGILIGAVLVLALERDAGEAPARAAVGAVARPPIAYVGDYVAALPQEQWARVECVARGRRGYCYGVRLRNGLRVVLRDGEVAR
jgi:hypothetical protein